MAHPREPDRRRDAQYVPAPLQLKQVTSFADAAQLLACWTVQAQQQQPASLMQCGHWPLHNAQDFMCLSVVQWTNHLLVTRSVIFCHTSHNMWMKT